MADSRFKPGDRVVRTGPTWNGAFNGQTYTVSRVDALGEMIDLIGVDGGCMFAFEVCNFRRADDQSGGEHLWASELRKYALQDTKNVDRDGVAHQVHPFCNTGKPRGKDVVFSAHVQEQIGGWCVLEQRSAIRPLDPIRFRRWEDKPC
jgi:hypothetical protein